MAPPVGAGTGGVTTGTAGRGGTGGSGGTTGGTTGQGGTGGSAGTPGPGGAGAAAGGSAGTSAGTGGSGTGGAVAFPLTYSADKRYLQDAAGTPFPILGRASWFVISRPVADYQAFVDDTLSRGFNAMEFQIITHNPMGNNPPRNGNNDLPFTKRLDGGAWSGALTYSTITAEAPDFTTPNEAYWAFVDTFLSYCESRGVLVFMFPSYVGAAALDQGMMQEMVANGVTRMMTYGAWIANRYKNRSNIIWMAGGDKGTGSDPFTQPQTDVESALLAGMRSVTGQKSVHFSAEWASEAIATDQTTFGASMTLNGAYSWTGKVATYGRRAYARTPVEPAFLLEEPYDEEGPDGNSYNPSATQPVRRFEWWGWLSTIGGYIAGNGYVWLFRDAPVDWRSHLDTQATRDLARLNSFIRSIPWWQLVPSGLGTMKTLVTAGGGSSDGDAGYVSAAATPAGTLLVAYVPPAHSGNVTIDMTVMSGAGVRARWMNPTTAAYTSIGTFPNTGTHAFTPPGDNGSGDSDWVLVLDLP